MTVVVDGSGGITTNSGTVVSTTDATLNGLTVGKGGGAVSTNTAVGASALAGNSTGSGVTALGYNALNASTANRNTAVGWNAASLTTSGTVTAVGAYVLYNNSTGVSNTAVGGNDNVTSAALQSNTTGSYNVGIGIGALQGNTTASNNTAVGYQAGYSNQTGANNVFVGYSAGYNANTNGGHTFVGYNAGLNSNSSSIANTFFGNGAGSLVTSGIKNTIIGRYDGNTGGLDIRTSSNYIVLSDGDGNPRFYVNNSGYPFFPSIRGSAGTYAARFTGAAELTLDTSSARYKDNIRDSVYGLDDILKMQSRQFEYKDDGRSDVGFVAEEMVDVIPEVVAIDAQGRPDAVSYDRLVSVCVKAIQELKTIVDAQAAEIAELKAKVGI